MVSKTPFVECLEESAKPCGAIHLFWIKKRDNMLTVEKVCSMWCSWCSSCDGWRAVQSWCLDSSGNMSVQWLGYKDVSPRNWCQITEYREIRALPLMAAASTERPNLRAPGPFREYKCNKARSWLLNSIPWQDEEYVEPCLHSSIPSWYGTLFRGRKFQILP